MTLQSKLNPVFTLASLGAALALASCHNHHSSSIGSLSTSVGGDSQKLFGATTTAATPAVARVGDLNADGTQDFGVGDPEFGTGGGRVVLNSGSTGKALHTLLGNKATERGLGAALAAAGDVDADGFADVVVGAPGSVADQIQGVALLVSGKTGAILQRLKGRASPAVFGGSVVGLGDVNGDGRGDVAVGEQRPGTDPAIVYAFSGVDGKQIWAREVVATGAGGAGPSAMCLIHDVNGDGFADLLVGIQGPAALVLSGRDGSVLRNHGADAAAVAALGDVDGDGVPDYALGFPQRNNGRGQVEIVSGALGQPLRTLDGDRAGALFGSSLAAAGDRNGDGAADILVGGVGAARLYSGANGAVLGEFVDTANPTSQHAVSGLGDLDGDGQPDYALSVNGVTKLCAAEPRSLSADRTDLSVSKGGVQRLSLRAGASNAGRTYVFLGTVSGTKPGLTFPGGVKLPINPDAYTNHTLAPSPSIHIAFVGALDASGNGEAQFAIPGSLSTALIGIELWHAGLVLGDQAPTFGSNAAPVVFVD